MKRILISIVLGTLVLFVWNAIAWMALPFHSNSLITLPEEAINSNKMSSLMSGSGIYHYPGFPEDITAESMKELSEKLENGPRITFMAYKEGPTALFEINTFLLNLFYNLFTVVLAYVIVSNQKSKSIRNIFTTCITLGLILCFASDLPQMNWFMYPMNYTLPNVLDHLVAFSLLGLIFGMYTFKNKAV